MTRSTNRSRPGTGALTRRDFLASAGLVWGGAMILPARVLGRGGETPPSGKLNIAAVGVGFWGGFMQAGVGFLLMPLLERLMAFDLVRVNMHKVFIVGCFTIPALAVFVTEGHVWWLGGAALAVGNAVGARLGARVTVEGGERVVRWVFVAAALVLAVRMAIAG